MSDRVRGKVISGLTECSESGLIGMVGDVFLPVGTEVTILLHDGDRRGEFERGDEALIKWAAGWARDACPEWDSDVTKGYERLREIAAALALLWKEGDDA